MDLRLGLEFLHYVQEVIVDLRLVAKLELDLVQVGESIFHLEALELLLLLLALGQLCGLYNQHRDTHAAFQDTGNLPLTQGCSACITILVKMCLMPHAVTLNKFGVYICHILFY